MSSVFFDIEVAIQSKLDSIVGHPKIQYENDVEYKPALNTEYWRVTHFPTGSTLVTTGAMQKHTGFFQVDIFTPANKGIAALKVGMDLVYTEFNTTAIIYENNARVDIMGVGPSKRAQRDGAWFTGSIDIYYQCYAH